MMLDATNHHGVVPTHQRSGVDTVHPRGRTGVLLPRIIRSALPSALLILSFPVHAGKAVAVEGDLYISVYSGGTLAGESSRRFLIEIDAPAYRVHMANPAVEGYVECVYDGQDLRTIYVSTPKSLDPRQAVPTNALHHYSAFISEGPQPRDDASFAAQVWLAYAAGEFLSTASPTNTAFGPAILLRPPWTLDDPALQNEGFRVAAKVRTELDAAGNGPVPAGIDFLSDGVYRGSDASTGERIRRSLPPPYADGYTNAVFTIATWDRLQGDPIPTRFTFTRYATPLSPTHSLSPRVVVQGFARRVNTMPQVHLAPPQFSGMATVYDERLAGGTQVSTNESISYGYVRYFITNGNWHVDSHLLAAYTAHQESQTRLRYLAAKRRQEMHRERSPGVVAIVLLLAATSPLLLLAYRRHHGNRKRAPHENN